MRRLLCGRFRVPAIPSRNLTCLLLVEQSTDGKRNGRRRGGGGVGVKWARRRSRVCKSNKYWLTYDKELHLLTFCVRKRRIEYQIFRWKRERLCLTETCTMPLICRPHSPPLESYCSRSKWMNCRLSIICRASGQNDRSFGYRQG